MADPNAPAGPAPDTDPVVAPSPRELEHAHGTRPGGHATPTQDTIVPTLFPSQVVVELPPPGYDVGALIGKGGMGEVVAAHDLRIGRDVAIKRMRAEHPDAAQVARFLREARIQARLDHPAIVPVYEVSTDADGRPFFTMKRITGTTLAERMAAKAPLPLLLRAFVDVCLAIELAHSRGVVHRDLKPANIMLGDFGEVYVLDWGVARVLQDTPIPRQPDVATLEGATSAGALLGTPGYMAPEQIHGAEVVPATDVYALGAILFEILTGQPLHPRGEGALGSTLTTPQQSPGQRAPEREIGPELDGACEAALAEAPADRLSARALADRVQRYLDGDRDGEARRALAAEHLAAAEAALAGDASDAREKAVALAGRALALDPRSEAAARVLGGLIFDPPKTPPPGLAATLDAEERAFNLIRIRRAQMAYVGLLATWLLVPFLDVVHWTPLLVYTGLVFVAMGNAYRVAVTRRPLLGLSLAINTLVIIGFAQVIGPFVLTPTLIAGGVLIFSAVRRVAERPWILITWVAVNAMAPFACMALGWLPRTWRIVDGTLQSTSGIFAMHGGSEELILVLVNLIFLCIICWVALANSRARWDSARKHLSLAWHLHQLLPEEQKARMSAEGDPAISGRATASRGA